METVDGMDVNGMPLLADHSQYGLFWIGPMQLHVGAVETGFERSIKGGYWNISDHPMALDMRRGGTGCIKQEARVVYAHVAGRG